MGRDGLGRGGTGWDGWVREGPRRGGTGRDGAGRGGVGWDGVRRGHGHGFQHTSFCTKEHGTKEHVTKEHGTKEHGTAEATV